MRFGRWGDSDLAVITTVVLLEEEAAIQVVLELDLVLQLISVEELKLML